MRLKLSSERTIIFLYGGHVSGPRRVVVGRAATTPTLVESRGRARLAPGSVLSSGRAPSGLGNRSCPTRPSPTLAHLTRRLRDQRHPRRPVGDCLPRGHTRDENASRARSPDGPEHWRASAPRSTAGPLLRCGTSLRGDALPAPVGPAAGGRRGRQLPHATLAQPQPLLSFSPRSEPWPLRRVAPGSLHFHVSETLVYLR